MDFFIEIYMYMVDDEHVVILVMIADICTVLIFITSWI